MLTRFAQVCAILLLTTAGTKAALILNLQTPEGGKTITAAPGDTFTAHLTAEVYPEEIIGLAFRLAATHAYTIEITGGAFNFPTWQHGVEGENEPIQGGDVLGPSAYMGYSAIPYLTGTFTGGPSLVATIHFRVVPSLQLPGPSVGISFDEWFALGVNWNVVPVILGDPLVVHIVPEPAGGLLLLPLALLFPRGRRRPPQVLR